MGDQDRYDRERDAQRQREREGDRETVGRRSPAWGPEQDREGEGRTHGESMEGRERLSGRYGGGGGREEYGRELSRPYGGGQFGGQQYQETSAQYGERGGFEGSRFGESGWRGGGRGLGRGVGQRGWGEREGSFAGRGPKGYQRSDERINEEVSELLTRDPEVDASEIEVIVMSGEVTLKGTVDSRQTKRRIEDLVDDISGVKQVNNQVRVKSGDLAEFGAGSSTSPGSSASGSSSGQSSGGSSPGSQSSGTQSSGSSGSMTHGAGSSRSRESEARKS